jgi:hypothetical protein
MPKGECSNLTVKETGCYSSKGRKCEHKIFGCPQCHSKKIKQECPDPCDTCKKPINKRSKDNYGYNCYDCHLSSYSFLICEDCNYSELDD